MLQLCNNGVSFNCVFSQTIKKKKKKLLLCLLERSGFQMHISGRRLNRDLKLSLLTKSGYRMLKLVTKIPEEGWVDIHMMILINSIPVIYSVYLQSTGKKVVERELWNLFQVPHWSCKWILGLPSVGPTTICIWIRLVNALLSSRQMCKQLNLSEASEGDGIIAEMYF